MTNPQELCTLVATTCRTAGCSRLCQDSAVVLSYLLEKHQVRHILVRGTRTDTQSWRQGFHWWVQLNNGKILDPGTESNPRFNTKGSYLRYPLLAKDDPTQCCPQQRQFWWTRMYNRLPSTYIRAYIALRQQLLQQGWIWASPAEKARIVKGLEQLFALVG